MDKETLSNYGWIVICVLVLAVMLALATPFGKFISNAIENTTTALFQTSKAGLGSAGIDAGELVFGKQDGGADNPDTPDVSNKLIPDGGIYKKADGTTLEGNGTNELPETPADGDEYEEGDYIYKYNQYYNYGFWESAEWQNGWSVKVKDTSKTEYGEILSEIAGKPVTNMKSTFSECDSLTTAPTIPSSVTNMESTFEGCFFLTTAPAIPSSVTNMSYTFEGCTFLKTYVGSTDSDGDFSNYTIPNSVTNMYGTFMNCASLTTAPAIPSSVTDMSYTFSYCKFLTTAPTIPNSVTNMDETFSGCTNLTTAPTIPNSVTDMSGTFMGCTSLKTYVGSTDSDGDFSNYTIPNSVTDMSGTFRNCRSLTTAPAIPNSVTNMNYTFCGCTSLTGTIEFNANPTYYDDCLKDTQITGIIGSCSQETKDALMATKG